MQLVKRIMRPKYKLTCLLLAFLPTICFAQENSPYSRYGVGNVLPSSNIQTRGMGGISAGYSDAATINTNNPATYGNLILTTLDVGIEYDGRTIKSLNPLGSYTSNNAIISYLEVAFPLLNGNKKAIKNHTGWAFAFGLKPVTRINYKIASPAKIGADSTVTVYEGNGGINEAFIGTALRLKNFSIGFNTGYLFGNKDYSSRLLLSNDSSDYFYSSNTKQPPGLAGFS